MSEKWHTRRHRSSFSKEFGVFVHRLLRSRSFSVRQPPDSIPLVKSRSLPLVDCVFFFWALLSERLNEHAPYPRGR